MDRTNSLELAFALSAYGVAGAALAGAGALMLGGRAVKIKTFVTGTALASSVVGIFAFGKANHLAEIHNGRVIKFHITVSEVLTTETAQGLISYGQGMSYYDQIFSAPELNLAFRNKNPREPLALVQEIDMEVGVDSYNRVKSSNERY